MEAAPPRAESRLLRVCSSVRRRSTGGGSWAGYWPGEKAQLGCHPFVLKYVLFFLFGLYLFETTFNWRWSRIRKLCQIVLLGKKK